SGALRALSCGALPCHAGARTPAPPTTAWEACLAHSGDGTAIPPGAARRREETHAPARGRAGGGGRGIELDGGDTRRSLDARERGCQALGRVRPLAHHPAWHLRPAARGRTLRPPGRAGRGAP